MTRETLDIGKLGRTALLCELYKNMPTVLENASDEDILFELPPNEARLALKGKDPIRVGKIRGKWLNIIFNGKTLDFTDYLHREHETAGFGRFRISVVLKAVDAAKEYDKGCAVSPVKEWSNDPLKKERDVLIVRLRSLIFNKDEEITEDICLPGIISPEKYISKAVKQFVPKISPGARITATHAVSWSVETMLKEEAVRYIVKRKGWPRMEPAKEFHGKFTNKLKSVEQSLADYVKKYVLDETARS